MKASLTILLVGLALQGSLLQAAELNVTVDAKELYESNYFGRERTDESANSMELGGRVELRKQDGRFRYDASYAGVYQYYWDQDDADDYESRLRLRGQYDIDRRTSLRVTNRFRDVSRSQFTTDDIDLGDAGISTQQSQYVRNDFEALWSRDLSETIRFFVAGRHGLVDFDDNETRSDSTAWEAELGMSFLVAENHRLGGSFSYIREDFDMSGARFGSTGEYLTSKLTWESQFSENGLLTVQAGPAWIESDEDRMTRVVETRFVGEKFGNDFLLANFDGCGIDPLVGAAVESRCDIAAPDTPAIAADSLGAEVAFDLDPPAEGLSDDDVAFFGRIALEITGRAWNVDLEATRQQNSTFGDSSVSILNRFSWQLEYDPPSTRWASYFAGSLERRDRPIKASFTDFVVVPGEDNAAERNEPIVRVRDSDDRQDSYTIILGVRTEFTPATSLSLEFRYRELEREQNELVEKADEYFVVLGLSHRFTPFRF